MCKELKSIKKQVKKIAVFLMAPTLYKLQGRMLYICISSKVSSISPPHSNVSVGITCWRVGSLPWIKVYFSTYKSAIRPAPFVMYIV